MRRELIRMPRRQPCGKGPCQLVSRRPERASRGSLCLTLEDRSSWTESFDRSGCRAMRPLCRRRDNSKWATEFPPLPSGARSSVRRWMLVFRHWQSQSGGPGTLFGPPRYGSPFPPEFTRRTRLIQMHDSSLRTPLDRAKVKRDAIEGELRKCPDFQLYLLTSSPK